MRDPDPREVRTHRSIGGAFADAAAFTNAVDISVDMPIAGERSWRVRFKASQAGTLKAHYLRPGGSAEYTANNPADVAVLANAETKIEDTAVNGESLVRIIFTPGATGTVTYADFGHF